MMKGLIVLFVSCYVVHSKAIECGIDKSNREEIRQALAMCVKNNDTLNKIWDMATSSQTVPSSGEEEADSTEENNGKSGSGSNAKNQKGGKASRIKRAKSAKSFNNQKFSTTTMRSTDNNNKMESSNDDDEEEGNKGSNDGSEETRNSSHQDSSDKCIIHCVLEKLSMTDDNGLPDHSKILEELLKSDPKRELKNFFQDSTDECFQEVDEANESDSCEYSNKLVFCLAEKGRSNCADWPAGNLPF